MRESLGEQPKMISNKFYIVFQLKDNYGTQVGCSIIPDCMSPNGADMYVVVSCFYESSWIKLLFYIVIWIIPK